MSELVARTGRHQQRYEAGYRLIAGCIPFRFRNMEGNSGETSEKIVQVLMINSTSGPGLLFPKHFLGHYRFKSKTLQDGFSPEGLCRAAMFALLVKEELESWPEQSLRRRSWLTVSKAIECCRHPWMRQVLEEGFLKWHDSGMTSTMNCED
ncbi:unnamed protein product [Withania somnifera]